MITQHHNATTDKVRADKVRAASREHATVDRYDFSTTTTSSSSSSSSSRRVVVMVDTDILILELVSILIILI